MMPHQPIPEPRACTTDPELLSQQATRCRRLARGIEDRATAEILERMAADYDTQARLLRP